MTRQKPETNPKRLIALAIAAALFALSIRAFVFGLYVVPSSSMAPTLLIGDYIFASKYKYGFSGIGSFAGLIHTVGRIGGHAPTRGDVIVFADPTDNRILLVKRLIGLPGDKVQMIKSELYINGAVVKREKLPGLYTFPGDDEPSGDVIDYIEYLPEGAAHIIRVIRGLEDEETINNTDEITVPPHSYFFMGDNRDRSDDSRVSDVGFVPEENLVGRAEATFFSMSSYAHIWEFSKWSWAMRWHRLFAKVI